VEEVAARINTPVVLRAFGLTKIRKFPAEVRSSNQAEDKEYIRYCHHTTELAHDAKIKGERKGAIDGKRREKLTSR
jgi:hypothetical protein